MRRPFVGARARRERELEEEIRAHLTMAAADRAARGGAPGESVRGARREFGNVTHVKEVTREAWGTRRIDHLTLHLRLAVRSLGRVPGFAIAVVLTLALGIGATSTLFAIVDRLFLRAPAGLVEPNRLHRLYVTTTLTPDGLPALQPQFAYGDYVALAEGLRSDGEVTAFSPPDSVSMSSAGEAQSIQAVYASDNYFSLLGVRPQLGRFFSADEERMGSPVLSAVMSDGLWQRSFGGRRDVVGATVTIDGREFTVVGIAQPGFAGTDLSDADLWLPLPTYPQAPIGFGPNKGKPWYEASLPLSWSQAPLELAARVGPGVATSHLAAVGTTVLRRSLGGDGGPTRGRPDSTAVALVGSINQALAPTLTRKTAAPTLLPHTDQSVGITWRLMAVVIVLLIIACLNVANLMLGRGMQRRRELAARIALGASRRHLDRPDPVRVLRPDDAGRSGCRRDRDLGIATIKALLLPGAHWARTVVDLRVLLFTGAVAVMTCVVVALIPGLQISREDVARSLTTGRGITGHAVGLRRALVITQSALSMVLLVGGGVFFQSLSRVRSIDVGYDVERLISGRVVFRDPQARYDDTWDHGQEIGLGLEQIAADLAREPSIQGAAIAMRSPMSSRLFTLSLDIPGRDDAQLEAAGLTGPPPITPVSPTYFETTGIRLLKGRFFTDADRSGAPTDYFVKEPYRAAVISAAMAKTVWPNEDPIGKCFVIGIMPGCVPIVGVVTDAHVMDVVESESMQYYVPLRPNGGNVLTIRVRPGQEAQASQLVVAGAAAPFPLCRTAHSRVACRCPHPSAATLADGRVALLRVRPAGADHCLRGTLWAHFLQRHAAQLGIGTPIGTRSTTHVDCIPRR